MRRCTASVGRADPRAQGARLQVRRNRSSNAIEASVSDSEAPIYLDFAATSAIRPPCVGEAVAEFLGSCGATPGRGGHRLAVEAGRMAQHCREAIARLLNIPGDPSRIAWMLN